MGRAYLEHRTRLPEEAYRRPVIAWEWFASLPLFELLLLGAGLAALARFREPFGTWNTWTNGTALRILVGVTTTALVWWFATADVNLFVGQVYLLDRLLLVAFAAGVWWDRFVREIVHGWNSAERRSVPIVGWIPPPRQMWLSSATAGPPPDEPIVTISVHQVVSNYDGEGYGIVRDRVIRDIQIDPSTSDRASSPTG